MPIMVDNNPIIRTVGKPKLFQFVLNVVAVASVVGKLLFVVNVVGILVLSPVIMLTKIVPLTGNSKSSKNKLQPFSSGFTLMT